MLEASALLRIRAVLAESAETKLRAEKDMALVSAVFRSAKAISEALARGNKVLLMGNGGSAADCQHIAGELVGRFKLERAALPAIALTVDTSILTAVGNDYGFDRCFERQVEALARQGDVVIGFSTSGNSPNVLKALERARSLGATTIGFTGGSGGAMVQVCDIALIAPAVATPRIQEVHITLGHIICELVEADIAGRQAPQS